MGKLYIVPTPIGNLGDMTFRGIEVLKSVQLILAEDTRKSGILLKHFEIQNRLMPFHKFNEHKQLDAIINRIKANESTALISDAGTPGISDPGFLLIKGCIDEGVEIECLPGATAVIPAIVNSGFPSDRFTFEGFLPHKKGRQKKLEGLKLEVRTMVFYESPHRLIKTLNQMIEFIGQERRICVCRELSKLHEEVFRGSIEEAILHFTAKDIKGEIVLVLEGFKDK